MMQVVYGDRRDMCTGICKSFPKNKKRNVGMYVSGHVMCSTCRLWFDHTGCRTSDGGPAIPGSKGWYCRCCGKKVRMRPRTRSSKEMIREGLERAGKRTAY